MVKIASQSTRTTVREKENQLLNKKEAKTKTRRESLSEPPATSKSFAVLIGRLC
jgi:hypothetical protein